MDYNFNPQVAIVYGVDAAIFIQNLYFWTEKNKANQRHYHDGRYWSYNSITAYTKLFPFWSKKQIYRIINKLKDEGIVHVGNYNTTSRDRTQWYALDEKVFPFYQTGKCICPNGEMEVPKRENASSQTVTPLPDSKPYGNPDDKPDISPPTPEVAEVEKFPRGLKQKVAEWEQYMKERRAPYTPTSHNALTAEIQARLSAGHTPSQIIGLFALCMANNWKSIVWDKLPAPKARTPTTTYDIEEFERSGAFDNFGGF